MIVNRNNQNNSNCTNCCELVACVCSCGLLEDVGENLCEKSIAALGALATGLTSLSLWGVAAYYGLKADFADTADEAQNLSAEANLYGYSGFGTLFGGAILTFGAFQAARCLKEKFENNNPAPNNPNP